MNLSRKHFLVLFVCFLTVGLLAGCEGLEKTVGPDEDDPGARVHVESMDNVTLEEDDDVHIVYFELTEVGKLEIFFYLEEWPEDYGLELMLFSESHYTDYTLGIGCSTEWHESISERGEHTIITTELRKDFGYHLVVDNTDAGSEATDFDFRSDDATFDIDVYYFVDEE